MHLPCTISLAALSSQAVARELRLLEVKPTTGLSHLPSRVSLVLCWQCFSEEADCGCLIRSIPITCNWDDAHTKIDISGGEVGLILSRPISADVIKAAKTLETSVT